MPLSLCRWVNNSVKQKWCCPWSFGLDMGQFMWHMVAYGNLLCYGQNLLIVTPTRCVCVAWTLTWLIHICLFENIFLSTITLNTYMIFISLRKQGYCDCSLLDKKRMPKTKFNFQSPFTIIIMTDCRSCIISYRGKTFEWFIRNSDYMINYDLSKTYTLLTINKKQDNPGFATIQTYPTLGYPIETYILCHRPGSCNYSISITSHPSNYHVVYVYWLLGNFWLWQPGK